MERTETTSFETYGDDEGTSIDFRCPQCRADLWVRIEVDGFDVRCSSCGVVIQCHFKLVMEWSRD